MFSLWILVKVDNGDGDGDRDCWWNNSGNSIDGGVGDGSESSGFAGVTQWKDWSQGGLLSGGSRQRRKEKSQALGFQARRRSCRRFWRRRRCVHPGPFARKICRKIGSRWRHIEDRREGVRREISVEAHRKSDRGGGTRKNRITVDELIP
ncbi:hypothetical protein U1Q18_030816 [Sarracenia purpurea var. burkii]